MGMRRAMTTPIPPPIGDPDQDQQIVAEARVRQGEQREQHGDRHAGDADEVALAGGGGRDRPRSARMKQTAAAR